MKKKVYATFAILIVLFSIYYYWQNRYVELRPVILNNDVQRVKVLNRKIVFFQNDFYKIAERNETPSNFYKNIKWVLEREHQEYIVKNGVIYIKYKYMNDYEMIWNHTNKTNDLEWFKSQRSMDSFNGENKKTEELDRIIKGFRN
ncbi:virulence-associated protein VapD [Flavobacterium sp. HSC-32F16]|uniref:hypothetical protein n=1 Tax=Flavobacterium sp. HSC-32F16 TaxID=2910964 RepID=UPI0020A2B433|nr:hypothetical protein [Flavobacterium sp. HSC-32F16]MCP2025236.1 virulence-associated protein VapD [Flavobacterium sp. HSC-32F16]